MEKVRIYFLSLHYTSYKEYSVVNNVLNFKFFPPVSKKPVVVLLLLFCYPEFSEYRSIKSRMGRRRYLFVNSSTLFHHGRRNDESRVFLSFFFNSPLATSNAKPYQLIDCRFRNVIFYAFFAL